MVICVCFVFNFDVLNRDVGFKKNTNRKYFIIMMSYSSWSYEYIFKLTALCLVIFALLIMLISFSMKGKYICLSVTSGRHVYLLEWF